MRLVLLALFVPLICLGQADTSKVAKLGPRTKLEEFGSKYSRLVQKEFLVVVKTKGIQIEVLKIKDLTTDETVSGLVIRWSGGVSMYTIRSYSVYMDVEELEDLSKALVRMSIIGSQAPPSVHTEYVFKSRSGFKVTLFADTGKPWQVSIEDDDTLSDSSKYFGPEGISTIQSGLQIAKTKF